MDAVRTGRLEPGPQDHRSARLCGVAKRMCLPYDPPAMPTVAEQLRVARETQNLPISRVAEATNIKTDYLRALESGQYETFSATIYVKGFVRTYATHLRLKVPELLAQLETDLAQSKKFDAAPRLASGSKNPIDFAALQLSKVNWQVALPILGILVLLVGIVWGISACRSRATEDPLSRLGKGIYQPANSGESLPLPGNQPPRR